MCSPVYDHRSCQVASWNCVMAHNCHFVKRVRGHHNKTKSLMLLSAKNTFNDHLAHTPKLYEFTRTCGLGWSNAHETTLPLHRQEPQHASSPPSLSPSSRRPLSRMRGRLFIHPERRSILRVYIYLWEGGRVRGDGKEIRIDSCIEGCTWGGKARLSDRMVHREKSECNNIIGVDEYNGV